MLYDYLIENYKKGEPIFISEISGYSPNYIRQEFKRLTDEKKINRLYNGVYYLPYKTILGTDGNVSINKFIEKKYLYCDKEINGYFTGLYLANMLGFTSQNPACFEICSNVTTTKQRKNEFFGFKIIEYKPVVKITKDNYKELQFLDLISNIDKYSELSNTERNEKLKKYVETNNLSFKKIKDFLPLYPDRIYKNLYNGGLMNELV